MINIIQNMDAFGQFAKFVEAVGEDLGFSKSWLRSEILKGIGADTVFIPGMSAKIEDVKKIARSL